MKRPVAFNTLAVPVQRDEERGSALVVEVGAQDEPLGNDAPDRTPFDCIVVLGNGDHFRTKVWWSGSRWMYAPLRLQVRRGITIAELDA